MSAISAPFGFRPSYHNSGQMRPKAYTIATAYAANIFSGDPVKLVADGVIELATTDGTRSPGVVATVKMLGIFAGVEYKDVTGKPTVSPFWPTGITATEIVAWVYDDPETLFDVQYNNPDTTGGWPYDTMQTAVGAECDWTLASPGGSVRTGLSDTYLTAIKSDGQFQITGFAHEIADSLNDLYIVATVRINLHQYKAAVTGV
jgi:hypothetical protein